MKVADFSPASSPGEASFISTAKPRRSAQRRYMRSRISAQSWESVPPAPALIVTTASPVSKRPEKSRSSSSSERRCSTEVSWLWSSPAISSSSSASSASSPRSSTSRVSRRKPMRRFCARACCAEISAAPDLSSQNPGRCISASRRSTSRLSASGSKVIREQLELPPDLGEPHGDPILWKHVCHVTKGIHRPLRCAQLELAPAETRAWPASAADHRGNALATRVAGLLLLGGAILIGVTVVLPPAAEGSDLLILGYGVVAGLAGVLMVSRRRVSEPVLGLAAALGTAMITLATLAAGQGVGAEDNEVLFLWVSLFAFWFFDIRHALLQLGLIGVADTVLLIDDGPTLSAGVTRWVVTIATLLVTGLLMSWLRRSLDREREETARLAVVAERMRIARDLHDAAGHGVTAISLQAAAGARTLDDDGNVEDARSVFEEIKRTARTTMEDMRKLLGLLRPSDAGDADHARVSLSHLDQMVSECRAAGLDVAVDRSGEADALPPLLDQAAYRITQEALTNVLKHAGSGSTATVRLAFDPEAVEVEVTDDGPGQTGGVAVGSRKGLIGMRERVELFGGSFSAGPMQTGGFRVFASLPREGSRETADRGR